MAQRFTALRRSGPVDLATLDPGARGGRVLWLAESEESRTGPMGAGDGVGNGGERAVASVLIKEAVLQHDDAMGLAAPLADESSPRLERGASTEAGLAPLCDGTREGL